MPLPSVELNKHYLTVEDEYSSKPFVLTSSSLTKAEVILSLNQKSGIISIQQWLLGPDEHGLQKFLALVGICFMAFCYGQRCFFSATNCQWGQLHQIKEERMKTYVGRKHYLTFSEDLGHFGDTFRFPQTPKKNTYFVY